MVQVPELDVAVAGRNKVGAVVGEGDGRHFTGHLIGCNHDVFLINRQQENVFVCLFVYSWQWPSVICVGVSFTFQFHTFTIMSCW